MIAAHSSEPFEAPDVPTTLWLAALALAGGTVIDPLPAELDATAAAYFALFPLSTKA